MVYFGIELKRNSIRVIPTGTWLVKCARCKEFIGGFSTDPMPWRVQKVAEHQSQCVFPMPDMIAIGDGTG